MPQQMTPEQRRAFLTEGTRTAVIATVRADGRPHAAPVWYALDGDDVLINMSEDTVKGRALRRDPRRDGGGRRPHPALRLRDDRGGGRGLLGP